MSNNDYASQRLANIKRNRDYLHALGLADAHEQPLRPFPKKKRLPERAPRDRPSARLRRESTPPLPPPPQAPKPSLAPGKRVAARPSSALVPTLELATLLARPHPFALSKTDAMYALAGRRDFVFGRMSGIQQFANAVALFVNIDGAEAARYENQFDERRLLWFAQSRQSASTPVIARIVGGAEPVFLLVKLGGQYTFCGRVRVLERFFDTRPLSFTLELLDRPMPAPAAQEAK